MKTYVADIIPKIQRFSQKLDNLTMLTNKHWVVLDELTQSKTVYIFRTNGELLIALNGKVDRGKWEYLGQNSILIDLKQVSYLFRHGFFDENILALKVDSIEEYAVLINESNHHSDLNNIQDVLNFLELKYLKGRSDHGDLSSKKGQALNQEITYEVLYEEDCFDIIWGNHRVYEIKYMTGLSGRIYKGSSTGKYFYLDYNAYKTYCVSFEEAVYNLFLSRTLKK